MSTSRRTRNFAGALLALGVVATAVTCQGPAEPAQLPKSATTPVTPPLTLTAVTSASERTLAPVDGASVVALPHFDADRLSASQRERLSDPDLPVLLPSNVAPAAMAPSGGAGWYAASYRLDGHTVLVSGSRVTFVRPGTAAAPTPDTSPMLRRTRGIVELSFSRAGASYRVHVDCAQPFTDPRCTGDDYALQLAASLALLAKGGSR